MPKFKITLPDLDTRSILNVVEENFQRLGMKSFAIRIIYTGEYTMDTKEMIGHFTKSVTDVNAGYCDIHLTGLLLVYDSFFVHIIEGSEDTVYRQLRFLFKAEQDHIDEMTRIDEEAAAILAQQQELQSIKSRKSRHDEDEMMDHEEEKAEETPDKPDRRFFKRLKLIMIYHSVRTLKFHNWRFVTARPPTLVSKLDVFEPLSYHVEQLRILINKINDLCKHAQRDQLLSFAGLTAADAIMSSLPEIAFLDFVLQSPHFIDLRRAYFFFRRVDDHIFYHEIVWPLPTHYTPRFLYKLKIDDTFVEPLPVMPWEKKEENEEEDEERDDRSDSDDSN